MVSLSVCNANFCLDCPFSICPFDISTNSENLISRFYEEALNSIFN